LLIKSHAPFELAEKVAHDFGKDEARFKNLQLFNSEMEQLSSHGDLRPAIDTMRRKSKTRTEHVSHMLTTFSPQK
jgi:hypothetical protein